MPRSSAPEEYPGYTGAHQWRIGPLFYQETGDQLNFRTCQSLAGMTREDARQAIFRYIEGWYNPKRRHSTLGYVSPAAYEEQLREAA